MLSVLYTFSCAHGGKVALRHGTYHCKENVNVCVTYACGKHKRDAYEEKIIWFGYLQPSLAKR